MSKRHGAAALLRPRTREIGFFGLSWEDRNNRGRARHSPRVSTSDRRSEPAERVAAAALRR